MNLQRRLESRWYSDRVPLLLRPLAVAYRAVQALRRAMYRGGLFSSGHPGVPVIVVGNVTVGGTGKTPLVMWLAGQLAGRGMRVGIACRGYGGRHAARGGATRLVTVDDDPRVVGDEASLLAREAGCPVVIGARRLEVARLLAAQGCQVVIADDGLQHLALRRDVEIAVVDGQRWFGNGSLLPAGPLREPVARLGQVDAVVVNGLPGGELPAGIRPFRMQLQPQQFVALKTGAPAELSRWRGCEVHAVAGIGNPQRFFASLRGLGAVAREHAFPDHHHYRAEELEFGDGRDIVMTAKDAVKCAAFANDRMWCLRVTAQFEPDDAARLMQLLDARLAGKH